jgi:hypothetical protein
MKSRDFAPNRVKCCKYKESSKCLKLFLISKEVSEHLHKLFEQVRKESAQVQKKFEHFQKDFEQFRKESAPFQKEFCALGNPF